MNSSPDKPHVLKVPEGVLAKEAIDLISNNMIALDASTSIHSDSTVVFYLGDGKSATTAR